MTYGNSSYVYSASLGQFTQYMDDYGGYDAIVSNYDSRYSLLIDLRPGQWSTFGQAQYLRMSTNTYSMIEYAYGGSGSDRIVGNETHNVLSGNAGNDTMWGMGGSDYIYGGNGSDNLQGGDGIDVLSGGASNDTLYGGNDSDWLYGNGGQDYLYGDAGADQFVFGDVLSPQYGGGAFLGWQRNDETSTTGYDVILGFDNPGNGYGDQIDLSAIDAYKSGPQDTYAGNESFVFNYAGTGGIWLVEWSGYTLLYGSTIGDSAPEFLIVIADGGWTAANYTAADFVL